MTDIKIGDLVLGSSNQPFWQKAGHCSNLRDLKHFANTLGNIQIIDVGKVIGITPELVVSIWATKEYGQWKTK